MNYKDIPNLAAIIITPIVTIHTNVIDNYDVFSKRELSERLIGDLFEGKALEKYKDYISISNETILYYFIIELKLAFFYKEIGDKGIKSAIAFINRFPKPKGKLDLDRLKEMFAPIDKRFDRDTIEVKVINSQTFDNEFADDKELLIKRLGRVRICSIQYLKVKRMRWHMTRQIRESLRILKLSICVCLPIFCKTFLSMARINTLI